MIEVSSAIDPGLKRKDQPNQDSLGMVLPGFFQRRPPLLMVADGMGGYEGGALASRLVIDTLSAHYRRARLADPLEMLEQGIHAAHAAIRRESLSNPGLARMGSTVVCAVVNGRKISIANVGDSRAYRINDQEVTRLSYDQSYVADQVRLGALTEAEARSHPRRNVLTMSLSAQRDGVEVFTCGYEWAAGDVLLLCSDGLWGTVADSQIQAVVMEMAPQAAAQKLVDLANTNQGPDNISVIVARFPQKGMGRQSGSPAPDKP